MDKSFTVFISGAPDSIQSARAYISNRNPDRTVLSFKLPYTPPYEMFRGIRSYQYATRYRPFQSEPHRRCAMILDLSEWLGHENEDYLRVFFKFLHDETGFYDKEYILTAGEADERAIRGLRLLAAEYLPGGQILRDKTLCDPDALREHLEAHYPLESDAADYLARLYLRRPIPGPDRVRMLTDDLFNYLPPGMIDVLMLTDRLERNPEAKINLFYGDEIHHTADRLPHPDLPDKEDFHAH